MWRSAIGQGMLSSCPGFKREPHVGGGGGTKGVIPRVGGSELGRQEHDESDKGGDGLSTILKSRIVEFLKQNIDVSLLGLTKTCWG